MMCLRYYRDGQIFAFNESFIFNPNDIADGKRIISLSCFITNLSKIGLISMNHNALEYLVPTSAAGLNAL